MNLKNVHLPTGYHLSKSELRRRRETAQRHQVDLPTRVQWLVTKRWNYDRIRSRVEREFPLKDPTPAQRLAFRERLARLVVRYRHGSGEKNLNLQ
jgi:hypothetical protein